MRNKRGFALVQVMLFGMLMSAMMYSMIIVQQSTSQQDLSKQKATNITPAIYDIVQYAIEQQAAGHGGTVTGDDFYDAHDPLSAEYEDTLEASSFDRHGVHVETF
jgi:hypothetical protein